jgi:hypothetical protein
MPQATGEDREEYRKRFGDIGCEHAEAALKARGYTLTKDWEWLAPAGHIPTEGECFWMGFLVDEWDYGYLQWVPAGEPTEKGGGRLMSPALSYIGFARLRPGRIHLYRPRCRRKMSNVERCEHDPPKATLAATRCGRCSVGDKENDTAYRDAQGRMVCGFCGRWSCERADGDRRCDERLINARVSAALTPLDPPGEPKGTGEEGR